MPLYDFRCADCKCEREVRVPFEQAGALELICIDCGKTMTKAMSRTVNFVTGSSGSASPSPAPRGKRKKKARTCSDGAVKLKRANPFAQALPPRVGSHKDG
jgi:putative FmdB family regulatory protein